MIMVAMSTDGLFADNAGAIICPSNNTQTRSIDDVCKLAQELKESDSDPLYCQISFPTHYPVR